jgi:hypothetical protein
MKVAFLTEMGFIGKIPANHPNMRTEFAWMHTLDADHYSIYNFNDVSNYDVVIVIFPKGEVFLNAVGSKLVDKQNPISNILAFNLIEHLKLTNKSVYYMQEGPHWLFNDYELVDQINFFNMLASCDGILTHNKEDAKYYKGLLPGKTVSVMPTLMIDGIVEDIKPQPEEKVIVGGNFARWYGGFESYIVAQEFQVPIWGQTSHAMRDGEEQLFNHLPRMLWRDWMIQLSTFKYAVHLMPTVAAGTFSLNCAYFGIPCIGNIEIDTQRICHPDLSVNIHDIEKARQLANRLSIDVSFYRKCSLETKHNYKLHFSENLFRDKMKSILEL